MTRFNQNAVVDKLNAYLQSKMRDNVLEYGYCHGFSLLWLYKMSEGKENWFYDLIQKIVTADPNNFDDIEIDIEKFLAHIEWMQNSSTYAPEIQQLDLDSVLEFPEKTPLSAVLSPRQFDGIIELIAQPNQMICLSCPTHSIGLYQRGKKYYLFDPNYDDGKAHEFTDKKILTQEIVKCLFKNLNIPTMKIALEINIVTNPDKKNKNKTKINKAEFLQQVAHSSDQVQAVDDFGINSLYLACENNDMETATYLLQRGASANQQRKDGETPLFVAAIHGYTSLVDLLLQHNAKTNLTNNDGRSPLYTAIENDRIPVVQTLLKNGANPQFVAKGLVTPHELAITQKKWEIFLLMLPYLKNQDEIIELHRTKIHAYKNEIQAALKTLATTLTAEEKKQTNHLLKQVFEKPERGIMELLTHRENENNRYRFFPFNAHSRKQSTAENTPESVLQHFKPNV
jgi:hypothetical protein